MLSRVDKYFNYRQQLKDQWLIFNNYISEDLLKDINKLSSINNGLVENISFPLHLPLFDYQKDLNNIDHKLGSLVLLDQHGIDNTINKINYHSKTIPIKDGLINKSFLMNSKDYKTLSETKDLLNLLSQNKPIEVPVLDLKDIEKIKEKRFIENKYHKLIELAIPIIAISLIGLFLILIIVFAIIL